MAMTDTIPQDGLRCFRHPERETYVRCGRCERPICSPCSMQGPVGLRCRDCGRPGPDPLTRLSPAQLAAGMAVGLGGGTVAGYLGLQMGFLLSLCAGPFVGALIGEGVMRATGYKRGTLVRALIVGGIVGGLLLAALLQSAFLWGAFGLGSSIGMQAVGTFVVITAGSGLLYVIAALFGAFTRIR